MEKILTLLEKREGIHNIFMHMFPTQLYIIRHAWAEECGLDQDDYDRRLTKKGRKRFEQFIRFMQGFGLEVDLIVTSPLVRTRETAEIMVDVLKTPRLEIHDSLAPGSNWQEIAEWTTEENVARGRMGGPCSMCWPTCCKGDWRRQRFYSYAKRCHCVNLSG